MANVFIITAATTNTEIDAERKGQIAFTVSNNAGRPLTSRASIKTGDDASPEWFSLEGDPVRSLSLDGTQQYTVQINVPADVAAGRYFFHLKMVGTGNPDEDFTNGPSVSFTVPEPIKEEKPFPWWIVLAVVGGLLVIATILFFALRGAPELTVRGEASADPVIAGRTMAYEVKIENVGRRIARGVVLHSQLPSGITYLSANGAMCASDVDSTALVCSLAEPIRRDSPHVVTLNVAVAGDARGTLTNTVRVALESDTPPTAEPAQSEVAQPAEDAVAAEAASHEAKIGTTAVGQLGLSAQLTGPTSVVADESIHYHIVIENSGPSDATDVILTYPMPDGILSATGIGTNGNCDNTGDSLRCEIGLVEAEASVQVTLTVLAGPTTAGELMTAVSLTDGDNSDVTSNTFTTQVTPSIGLGLGVSGSSSQALLGESFVYTVQVWNGSSAVANDVELRYRVPDGWLFERSEPECKQELFGGTTTLICGLGNLPADPDNIRTIQIFMEPINEQVLVSTFDIRSSGNLPDEQFQIETPVAKAFSAVGLRFDGVNDWVELDDFDVPESFTIEMWMNPNPDSDSQNFIGKHTADGGNIFLFGYYDDVLHVRIRDQTYGAGQRPTGLHHFAVVVEKRTLSQSFIQVYQNGVLFWDQEIASVLGDDISGLGWVLGQDWDNSNLTDFYSGTMADVRIWDHVRTQQQIEAMYDTRLVGDEEGLIAYLPLTEQLGPTANDQTGNGHNGTLNLGPVWVDAVAPPDFGNALSLNGRGSFGLLPASNLYNFARNQDFTIEFWMNPASTQLDIDNSDNDIIEKWSGGRVGYPFVIRYINRGDANHAGRVLFARYDGANNPSVRSTARINDNQFHHIAAVHLDNELYLYIDGVLQGTQKVSAIGPTTNNSQLYIGRRGGSTDNLFTGTVDDLRIWNIGRSQADIEATMNRPLSGNEAGLIGYWRFDETVTFTVTFLGIPMFLDSSGMGNDGIFMSGSQLVPSNVPTR